MDAQFEREAFFIMQAAWEAYRAAERTGSDDDVGAAERELEGLVDDAIEAGIEPVTALRIFFLAMGASDDVASKLAAEALAEIEAERIVEAVFSGESDAEQQRIALEHEAFQFMQSAWAAQCASSGDEGAVRAWYGSVDVVIGAGVEPVPALTMWFGIMGLPPGVAAATALAFLQSEPIRSEADLSSRVHALIGQKSAAEHCGSNDDVTAHVGAMYALPGAHVFDVFAMMAKADGVPDDIAAEMMARTAEELAALEGRTAAIAEAVKGGAVTQEAAVGLFKQAVNGAIDRASRAIDRVKHARSALRRDIRVRTQRRRGHRRAVRLSAQVGAGSGADGPPEPPPPSLTTLSGDAGKAIERAKRPPPDVGVLSRRSAALTPRSARGPPRARGPPCPTPPPAGAAPRSTKPRGLRILGVGAFTDTLGLTKASNA